MTRMLIVIVATALMGGCALSPGMKMKEEPLQGKESKIQIIPITAEVVYRENLAETRSDNPLFEQSKPIADYEYRIGPRDVLSITVWDHPELTIPAGEFREAEAAGHLVAEDGTIFYPYVGSVKVAGLTMDEVRKVLTQRIRRTIANPQLDVRVAAFRSQKAYVVGEVAVPGPQPITDIPLTVVEAINRSGGVTAESDMLNVRLTRDGNIYDIDLLAMYDDGDVRQNILLKDGDILHVPDQNQQKVFILGEVGAPSSLLMHKGKMTLAEAISDVGGFDRTSSNPEQVFVIRGTPDAPQVFHLNAKSPAALILGDQFKLKPRDVVYVETAGVTRWNRVIEQILPTVNMLRDISNIERQQAGN